MKPLLLLPILALPLLLSACDTLVVARPVGRTTAYVERDYDRRYDNRYDRYDRRDDRRDDRYDRRRDHRDVVVIAPKPAYRPQVSVRYYSDTRGRYYIKDGRRIYVNAGVHY